MTDNYFPGRIMLKAIIFDVGGVLIRTESRTGREKWATRFGLDSWDFENFVFRGESGLMSELGQRTVQEHWRWLGQHFGLEDDDLLAMRRDFYAGDVLNEHLVAYVKRLRQAGYRTGLLSNFGDNARRLWAEVYPFIDYFDGVTISAEVGIMKPDPRIYRLAAESLGVEPEESLFVDDFIQNVEGARRAGMQALHFTGTESTLQQLIEITAIM
jgi:HAD superfamily hydrolase (TIGR01509 family)